MNKLIYEECGGKLFVNARYSGISFLVIMIDRIPVHYLGKGKTTFLLVDDAIDWHEREIEALKDWESPCAFEEPLKPGRTMAIARQKGTNGWPRKSLDALISMREKFLSAS
jgi:hypothetical protein